MTVEFFGHQVAPGERARFRVKVAEQNDGTDVTIPVIVIHGVEPGPAVALTGAIHGDEYAGWNVMRTLLPTIEPRGLRGTVVALPITNPFAFYVEARVNTFDYEFMNLNRIWPGDPAGFLSQRMAHTIFQECLRRVDCIVDYHEGGRDFLARYVSVGTHAHFRGRLNATLGDLATWFGHGIPIKEAPVEGAPPRPTGPGTLSDVAVREGIAALVPEVGGGGSIWDHFLADSVEGTRNVLIGLTMLDGEMRGLGDQLVVKHNRWVRADHGGLLVNRVSLGDVVDAGAVLGHVLDPFGDVVQTLQAPFRSVLLDTRFTTALHPGDWAFSCGQLP